MPSPSLSSSAVFCTKTITAECAGTGSGQLMGCPVARSNACEHSAGCVLENGQVAFSDVAAALTITDEFCELASGVTCTSSSLAMLIAWPAAMPSMSTRAPVPPTVRVAWNTTLCRPQARLAVNARLRSLTAA